MSNENNAIGGEYESFEQLFNDAAIYMDAIKGSIKPNTKHYDLPFYNVEFNTWLTNKCGWNGAPDTYDHFLTRDFFKRFMEYKTEQENELIANLEQQRQSWEIRKPGSSIKGQYFQNNEYTHRHYAIAEKFKNESGEIEGLPTRQQQREAGGKKREQAFDSINTESARFVPIKLQELQKVIELLADYPKAKQRAKIALDILQKS